MDDAPSEGTHIAESKEINMTFGKIPDKENLEQRQEDAGED